MTNASRMVEYHDTLRLREYDSVFVYVKGDTIWRDRWHYREKERVVERLDTAYVEIQLAGEPYIPDWGKRLIGIAAGIVVLFVLWLVYKAFRIYIKMSAGI